MRRKTSLSRCQLSVLLVVQMGLKGFLAGQPRFLQLVPPDAESKVKEAYAALKQGEFERARDLAEEVFRKYGNVQAAWYPSWLLRVVKGKLPAPYLPANELGQVDIGGSKVPLTNLRYISSPARILFEANWELSRFDEIVRWGKVLMQSGERSQNVLRRVELAEIQLRQGWVYRIKPKPARNNWRPLPIQFRLEDYFVVVPLNEAAKVLGFKVKVSSDPKFPSRKVIFISLTREPAGSWVLLIAHPFAYRLEDGSRKAELLAYAVFEEKGKIWVPFYWLAEKSGLQGWELRERKIYAPPR